MKYYSVPALDNRSDVMMNKITEILGNATIKDVNPIFRTCSTDLHSPLLYGSITRP